MHVELWQVPLLVMLALVAGQFIYVAIADRWSPRARLWIKMIALVALGCVVLAISYQLLLRAELSVVSTLLGVLMLFAEGFLVWIGWKQLKASGNQQS
jgi:hypothetical protein